MEKLPKIKSITKKLVVALLGGFLLLFLAFHMCANLFVLCDDGGTAYSEFCHFMGTNVIVKVFELVLMAAVLLHIVITILLWFENRKARGTVRYHVASKTKTAMGSKITIWTGILILVFLCVHFWGFYFVKLNVTHPEGHTYMAKTDDVRACIVKGMDEYQDNELLMQTMQYVQYGMPIETVEQSLKENGEAMAEEYGEEAVSQALRVLPLFKAMNYTTEDGKWSKGLSRDDRNTLKSAGVEVEPDFYHNVRYMFSKEADESFPGGLISVLLYLFFFVVLWFHLRHALEACFQTLGLTNYKYHRAIELIGIAYAWIICLGFAALPIILYFL